MKTNERILRINSVLQNHFIKHPQSGMVLAKEFMPLFIENGIFNKDYREGLPIRKVLRDRKSTRLNSSHASKSRMPSSA